MQVRKLFYAFLALFLTGISITVAGDGVQRKYLPSDKEFYLNEAEIAWLRPGIQLKIQSAEISGTTASVTYRISDDQDQPLDRLGIETPGVVSFTHVLARIKPGESQYTSYTTRTGTTFKSGTPYSVPIGESNGTYTSLGNGVYKYTFATKLPDGFEADATHTVGMYARRDLRTLAEQLGLTKLAKTGLYVGNDVFNFVPSGKPVAQVRDVVRTEACNQCHNPLQMHGGSYRQTGFCILCHQPQNFNIDSGNSLDFKVYIHKLHRSANLPSVRAGKPYQIISSFRDAIYDFSEIHWPQDVRNCTTCHQQGTQSDNWKTNPNRAACGSCHDDVNFATGEHHPGGVQVDDSKCSICHASNTGLEFDLSVDGVHTIPAFSKQLKGLHVAIVEITNTKPGDKPTVSFTVKDNAGNTIGPLSSIQTLALRLAGPTTDYTFNVSEDARTATATPTGYTYTFKTNALPTDAKGTYAAGAEARRQVTIPGSLLGQSFTATESIALNPVKYFSVDGSAVVPRRKVVDIKNCNVCHKRLAMHGGTRTNATEYCQMCHNPATVDNPDGSRAAAAGRWEVPEGTPPTSINFRFMIHRWHTGSDLTRDYKIYRTFGIFSPNEEVHFPGDRRNCSKCHVGNSYQLPLPAGMANTVAPREFYSPMGPAASACLGCHDTESTAAHAFLMTSPFGEACAACHGEGKEFSVTRAHAR